MCLAQRGGVRRKGKQRNYVRNCVSEMGNNLWVHKYKAFGKLKDTAQRKYWSEIFAAYKAVYAAASADASTPAQEERVAQLVAQTEEALQGGRGTGRASGRPSGALAAFYSGRVFRGSPQVSVWF